MSKNILNKKLQKCSIDPITGYNRSGYCKKDENDMGKHLVCAVMDNNFLNFTKSKGNDLSTVVKNGDKWCICEDRYMESVTAGKEPRVIKDATSNFVNTGVKNFILKTKGGKTKKLLPKLRKIDEKNKRHKYKIDDPQSKRILAMKEGINYEVKQGKTKKQAAIAKKGRFNILRIYRRNSNKRHCRRITKDMKYLDKTYKLGKTTNICKGGGKRSTKKREFLYNPDDPKKSFDVYIDKDPSDTIPIKYTTVKDVKDTIKKLERLYKKDKYSHKRIWQVGMIMKVRLEAIKKNHKKAKDINKRFEVSEKYFKFLGQRTKTPEINRKKMVFKL
tara:strand:- start:3367 stop:4359 length:993 start_codon:yes stop_codon:yes gene_type:complete